MSLAVLIPHFNNVEGLKLTFESLLNEDFRFTVFVIDDGSFDSDNLVKLVNQFKNNFEIVLILRDVNSGITDSLNIGLTAINNSGQFDFVARLDAGDQVKNSRFKDQVDFFNKNPHVGLLGSYVSFVDLSRNELFVFKPPLDNAQLCKALRLYNPFIHPVVMYRLDVIEKVGLYPSDFPALEDHAYFLEISKVYDVAVLDKVHLTYEVNPNGISLSKRNVQTRSRIRLLVKHYDFSINSSIGIVRAFLTYMVPRKFLTLIKKFLYRK